jgi:hypothetical protein
MSTCRSWGGVRCALVPMALAAALHPPASAQQSLFKVVSGHEYREVIDPKHPVSGHTVVGASLVAAAGAPLRTRQLRGTTLWFYVTQPLQANDQVRVDLDSPDGRFHGTGMWQLEKPVQANTWVLLPLPLKPGELRRPELPEGHLAVSVRVFAAGQSASPRPFAAVLDVQDMEAPAQGDTEIWLQVNARRAQMMVRGSAGASARKCEPVASASVVRFDTLCKIATSQLERTPQGRYRLTLLRRDGFSYTPESVELEMK